MSLPSISANSFTAYSCEDEKPSMSDEQTPRRKKQPRKRAPKNIGLNRMTDAEFVLFLGNEESERETDPLYNKSDPIFMTYIEKRTELAQAMGLAEVLEIPETETVPIFDVYIGIDCFYRSIGWFFTLEEAKLAASSARVRWERHLKNHMKSIFGLDRPWIPPSPDA